MKWGISISLDLLQFAGILFLGRRLFLLEASTSDETTAIKSTIGALRKNVEEVMSRNLRSGAVPFTKVDRDWVADPNALFVFKKGVVIGYKNPECVYGAATLSVDVGNNGDQGNYDGKGSNCPSGRGSVTFGGNNVASGAYSSVLGGGSSEASGSLSSVLGGNSNKAIGHTSSVSGGWGNQATTPLSSVLGGMYNKAIGRYSSVSGGHYNEAIGYGSSVSGGHSNSCDGYFNSILGGYEQKLNLYGNGNDFDKISTIPESSPVPFTRIDSDWVADPNALFVFKKGVVIGNKNPVCEYGAATLSVDVGSTDENNDRIGMNCPSGPGSVTFGRQNMASGSYSSVLGGSGNKASGTASSVLSGKRNMAIGNSSSVSGGNSNQAINSSSSILGGVQAEVPFTKVDSDWIADPNAFFVFEKGVIIGYKNPDCEYGSASLSVDVGSNSWGGNPNGIGTNCPSGRGSVTFGYKNIASGPYSSVPGGGISEASGSMSSVLGGNNNKAIGPASSVSGGSYNQATKNFSSVLGGNRNNATGAFSSISGGQYNEAIGHGSSVSGGYSNSCDGYFNSILGGSGQKLNTNGNLNDFGPVSTIPESSPESPFSCTGQNCTTERSFTFFKEVEVKEKLTFPNSSPESPFTCTGQKCVTDKNFKFLKNLHVKRKFCATRYCS